METYTTHKPLIEIDSGDFNRILEISQDLVAKVPLSESITNRVLRREYEMMQDLHECGIYVPRPVGFFNIILDLLLKINSYGIVMQRLIGQKVQFLKGSLLARAEELMDMELKKCLSKGFLPYDEGEHNAIYCPGEEKVYLIDFQGWKRRNF